ncbi:galectin-1-like [Huso huso]|uniref:Galectin n=1 Tax=Huso huso TaxID=61971 RepID=A0ABR0YFW9_HUSHU
MWYNRTRLLTLTGLSFSSSFAFNIGRSDNEFSLHFNPRFDEHGDTNTIVCNSRMGGVWGEEQRDHAFPFKHGEEVKVIVKHREVW